MQRLGTSCADADRGAAGSVERAGDGLVDLRMTPP
jgi:hypothetical protein